MTTLPFLSEVENLRAEIERLVVLLADAGIDRGGRTDGAEAGAKAKARDRARADQRSAARAAIAHEGALAAKDTIIAGLQRDVAELIRSGELIRRVLARSSD